MDGLYFRVSSERQTTENQFEDLLQVAEKDGSSRDWSGIREALATVVIEERRPGTSSEAGCRKISLQWSPSVEKYHLAIDLQMQNSVGQALRKAGCHE